MRYWTMLVGTILSFALSDPSEAGIERDVVGAKETIECHAQSVEVNGASSDLTLLGDCPHLEVNGSNNTVRIEQARQIEITGVGNTVIWERGANGRRPKVENTGIGNTVHQGRVTSPAEEAHATTGTTREEADRPAGTARGERAAAIAVLENGRTQTIACAGGDVRVDGNANRLTLTGECGHLHVNGNGNVVRVERAALISVLGSTNRVTWKRGVGGASPKLTNLGDGNDIARASE